MRPSESEQEGTDNEHAGFPGDHHFENHETKACGIERQCAGAMKPSSSVAGKCTPLGRIMYCSHRRVYCSITSEPQSSKAPMPLTLNPTKLLQTRYDSQAPRIWSLLTRSSRGVFCLPALLAKCKALLRGANHKTWSVAQTGCSHAIHIMKFECACPYGRSIHKGQKISSIERRNERVSKGIK